MDLNKIILLSLNVILISCSQRVSTYQLFGSGRNDKVWLKKGNYVIKHRDSKGLVSKTGTYTLHNDTVYFKPIMLKKSSEKDTLVNGKKLTIVSCTRGELDSTVVKGYFSHGVLHAFGKKYKCIRVKATN